MGDYKTDVTIDRNRGLGGSDISGIMGINPFVTRMDLLMEKAGIKERPVVDNEYVNYGKAMESKIRDYINSELGFGFEVDYTDDEDKGLYYHADGVDHDQEYVLEVKTTSQIHDDISGYKTYEVQLLYGMMMFDYPTGILAVYERPEDMSEEFDKDRLQVMTIHKEDCESLLDEINRAIDNYKKDLAYLKENPLSSEDELPSRKSLAEWEQKSLLIGDKEFTAEWLLGAEKEITDAIKSLKEELCEQMEEHSISHCDFENGARVTYVPKGKDTETEKLDDKRLKEEEPSIYAKYLKKSVRKGKKAYVLIKH